TQALALIGSKEGIANLHVALVDPGDVVLVPAIGYPVYATGALLRGATTHEMAMNAENGWLADFDSVPDDVAARAKIMFLGYPNNPTGAVATDEYFRRAIDFCRTHDI